MSFAWPWMLLSLGALPLLLLAYRRLLRRRTARRTELASLGLVAPGEASSVRRHVAPTLVLIAMSLLFLALARPQATVSEARREGTVVLAFDVSASMAATDMAPTRMDAAKAAARAFVAKQPSTVEIGVVAFSGSGLVTQQPTNDRARILEAVDRLTPRGDTALGRGLQTSLSAITGKTVRLDSSGDSVEAEGENLGYHGSAAVILLSDGENKTKPDPLDVAKILSTAGVRVYSVGLGSPQGTVLEIDGFRVATALDEGLLREIADTTDARYFAASDEKELAEVYQSIELGWKVEAKRMEVTALVAAAAGVLLLLAAGLSLAWFRRVI